MLDLGWAGSVLQYQIIININHPPPLTHTQALVLKRASSMSLAFQFNSIFQTLETRQKEKANYLLHHWNNFVVSQLLEFLFHALHSMRKETLSGCIEIQNNSGLLNSSSIRGDWKRLRFQSYFQFTSVWRANLDFLSRTDLLNDRPETWCN